MVVALAGRRIDPVGGGQRRFPAEFVDVVHYRIASALKELHATTLVCAAACGADLVALRAAAEIPIARRIVLPFDPTVFRSRSVTDRGDAWGPEFDRAIDEARANGTLIVLNGDPADDDAFLAANRAILDEAVRCAGGAADGVRTIAVWDGPYAAQGDTTAAFVDSARARRIAVQSIPIIRRRVKTTSSVSDDDMIDADDELPSDQVVREALLECRKTIVPPYVRADREALTVQRTHRRIVWTSALLGTAAIVVALLQLLPSAGGMRSIALPLDALFTVVGALAVALGLFASVQQRWYLQRHRAEMLRLLKYRMLVNATTEAEDAAPTPAWKNGLAAAVERVCAIDRAEMQSWMEEKTPDAVAAPAQFTSGGLQPLEALRTYYLERRLGFQQEYFYRKAQQYHATDRWLRAGPPVFFLLSVVFACVHFAIAIASRNDQTATESAASVPIVISAICVVIAGMFRLVRSANEYARNTMRFRAKYFALVAVGTRLEKATGARDIATTILENERILEEEHREWLRLMQEAEWFG